EGTMHARRASLCVGSLIVAIVLLDCTEDKPTASPDSARSAHAIPPSPAQSANSPAPPALDPSVVARITGIKPEVAEGVAKISYPRTEIKVEVDGWTMPPFMGITSWAGFEPGGKPGIEAMVMGDLV